MTIHLCHPDPSVRIKSGYEFLKMRSIASFLIEAKLGALCVDVAISNDEPKPIRLFSSINLLKKVSYHRKDVPI